MINYFVIKNNKTGVVHVAQDDDRVVECSSYIHGNYWENLGKSKHIGNTFVTCKICKKILLASGIVEKGEILPVHQAAIKLLLLHLDKKIQNDMVTHITEFNIIRQACQHRKHQPHDKVFSCKKIKTPSYHECKFDNCPYLKGSRPEKPFQNPTTISAYTKRGFI